MNDPGAQARQALGEARSVERDGRTIGYWAAGQGPLAVLVASAGREASDFNELADTLSSAGRRTLAVDPPGIGASSLPADARLSLFDLADDLLAVIEAEGGGRTEGSIAIGHAFGNRVVRALASRHDEAVAGLVLIASGGRRPIPERAARALNACFDATLSAEQHGEAVRYGFFADGQSIPDYWLRGWHGATAVMQGGAGRGLALEDWEGGGSAPILLLQADADRIAPKEDAADVLAAAYPDRIRVVMIPNAGHALLPEQPALIAKAVLDFLRRL